MAPSSNHYAINLNEKVNTFPYRQNPFSDFADHLPIACHGLLP
jgi:hypothetical protein